ncbi:hypothetical protein ZEAMMB73_Zm00001d005657, partial [Zea mays]
TRTAQSSPTTSRLLSPVLSSTPHAGTRETQGEKRARACISIAGASSCDRRSITTAPHPCVSSVFLSYVRLFLCLELAAAAAPAKARPGARWPRHDEAHAHAEATPTASASFSSTRQLQLQAHHRSITRPQPHLYQSAYYYLFI